SRKSSCSHCAAPPQPPLFPYTTLFRSRASDQQADNSPARLLSGDLSELRSSYDVSAAADDKAAFRLVPRGSESPYRYIEFTFKRSEEHTSELQSRENLVCRLLLENKND